MRYLHIGLGVSVSACPSATKTLFSSFSQHKFLQLNPGNSLLMLLQVEFECTRFGCLAAVFYLVPVKHLSCFAVELTGLHQLYIKYLYDYMAIGF